MTTNQAQNQRTVTRVVQPGAPDLALANYLDSMLREATSQLEETEVAELTSTVQTVPEAIQVPEMKEPVPVRPVPEKVAAVVETPVSKPEVVADKPKNSSLNEIKARLKEKLKEELARSEQISEVVSPEPVVAEATPVSTESVEEVLPETENVTTVVNEPAREVSVSESEQESHAWLEAGIPAWGEGEFDCLMFTVDVLSLGIPMLLLGTLYPLDQDITPLIEQPDWFMGLMRTQDERHIRVVDTAALVMADRVKGSAEDRQYKFGIGIFGTEWALAAATIEGSKVISSSQVKWRTKRTSRAWLAGTIKDEMCAIVDPAAFVEVLLEKKGKRRKP